MICFSSQWMNQKKRKAFSIKKADILVQVDANKETCCTGCQIRNCDMNIEQYC
jgi:ApbE superfamily uncharacterized protein (UPF0280 family)